MLCRLQYFRLAGANWIFRRSTVRRTYQTLTFVAAITCLTAFIADGAHAAEDLKDSPVGRTVADFTLKDFRGKPVSLSDFKNAKAIVVAFLGCECPLAKLYGPNLQRLADNYREQGVVVLGINPNVQDSITELEAYGRRHDIKFPLLKDVGNQVADAMKAKRTPEVYLLDSRHVIRYWGRVDDRFGIGYVLDEPRNDYLRAALDQVLAGKLVTTPSSESQGCIIGRVREPQKDAKVTYSNQISRLLQKRCVECHRKGEIAPFELTDYKEVAGWAEMMQEVVDENRMPPWHASEKHGDFDNDRRMTAAEKQLIRDWVAAGAPEGDPKNLPQPRQFTSGWSLSQKPDAVFYMRPKPYDVPAEGTVRYQYFSVDPDFKEDKWISAAEVQPGNRAVVHHILVFVRTPGKRFGDGDGFLAAYVPGMRAEPFPAGMAKLIPAGAKLYFQVHYTPIGSKQLDRSKVGFVFADPDTVKYEVRTASATNQRIAIPPGDDNYKSEATSGSVGVDVKLLTMMPHMHLRGKSFSYEAVYPDGKRKMLLDVPEYDFNWQTGYRLKEPMTLPAGTKLHTVAHFDNSEENLANPDPTKTVKWGPQTWHEMHFGYFDYATPVAVAIGREAVAPSPARLRYAQGVMKKFDRNNDGKIARNEVGARLILLFNRLDTDKDDYITVEELTRLAP